MTFALALAGIMFVTSGVRGTSQDLAALVKGDFSGPNNFAYWFIAVLVIGGLGYIEDLRSVSRAFLALIIIVLLLTENQKNGDGGFFQKFTDSVSTITGNGATQNG
jgi:hypothetical protein